MRERKKNILLSGGMVFVLVVINALVFWRMVCGAESYTSRNVYGEETTVYVEHLAKQQNWLASFSEDAEADRNYLLAAEQTLEEYAAGLRFVMNNEPEAALGQWYELPEEERAEAAKAAYAACEKAYGKASPKVLKRIEGETLVVRNLLEYRKYLDTYPERIKRIASQANDLGEISLFANNETTMKNILKTQKDFYSLEKLAVVPVVGEGWITLLHYRVTDFFAVLIPFLSLLSFRETEIYGRNRRLWLPLVFTVVGVVALYGSNYVLSAGHLMLPPGDTPVQSIEAFAMCPYTITTGALTALSGGMKVVGCLLLLFVLLILLTAQRKKRLCVGGIALLILAGEAVVAYHAQAPFVLQEVNLFSLFSYERFYERYGNLHVFGQSCSRLPFFLILVGGIFLVLLGVARKGMRQYAARVTRENEQRYFDEVNRQYIESRKIKHDINNHLLALQALIEKGQIDEAKRYIRDVSEKTENASNLVNTGSKVINALLFKKTEKAQAEHKTLVLDVRCSLSALNVSDYDLCSVFGNMLDNALEATREGDEIILRIDRQMDMLYIACENPFVGELRKSGDRIVTTKANPEGHGYGIRRIREIAGHYGGEANVVSENGCFRIEVLLTAG